MLVPVEPVVREAIWLLKQAYDACDDHAMRDDLLTARAHAVIAWGRLKDIKEEVAEANASCEERTP